MIELQHLKKEYITGDFHQLALDDVSLTFRKNEFVAILGPSGSGKTTLLNIIGGLDRYDSGDLLIQGTSTKEFKDGDWDAYRNNSVGFIFQSYNLISHLSVADNVEMGMTLSGVRKKVKQQKALEVLEQVGLSDHVTKKPNQLSGGQMQRVAIARSLANNPEVILADEPTGALDTHTSEQIMELIQSISKDKLVLMVTHNPELAEAYADRIIRFSDGQVLSDSNPYEPSPTRRKYKPKKTSMNFFTALKLSGNNIITKKWRTGLTAFASSIGIIGIALVLSLSNGFNKQVGDFEKGSLANYPITIGTQMQSMHKRPDSTKAGTKEFTDKKQLFPVDLEEETVQHKNKLSDEYLTYIDKLDRDLVEGINYTRQLNLSLLDPTATEPKLINTSSLPFSSYPTKKKTFDTTYLETNYDVLAGQFPHNETELALIVDESNKMPTTVLTELGFKLDKLNPIDFDDIIGKKYQLIHNNDLYQEQGELYKNKSSKEDLKELKDNKNNTELTISSVIRIKEDASISTLPEGIVYSDLLAQTVIKEALDSNVVKAQNKTDYNILTGQPFGDDKAPEKESSRFRPEEKVPTPTLATKAQILAQLGATEMPVGIDIHPKNFESKDKVITYLDKWNKGKKEKEKIIYTDLAAMMVDLTGNIMDGITIVLIAFAGVSLLVSMIMIGIIIYISVLERTKEIGVLRSLGARKKDVTRVFNAETFIVGLFSGSLGIAITYLLTIPINKVFLNLADLENVAQLNPLHAGILILISVVLTMIGGAIPAKMASKKDPVTALRSE